jgi:GNAT superfamily N-acetyltransferase|tara:strand:- start:149 stop:862 length:714 start_codon:yes stop_codon:yes gene_type:complete
MKKILNEWRKFLIKESAPSVPFSDENLEPNLSLFVSSDDETYQLVLYRKEKYVDGFYIVGYASVDLLSDDGDERFSCIPQTYQVSAIYVEKELRGKGYGSLLYSLAFAVIPSGAGLTSDKYSGTQPEAAGLWNRMEKSGDYELRQTPKGNNEFDYDGKKTPEDKMDDCRADMDLGDSNATDHSIQKKNNSDGKQLMTMMSNQHQQNDFLNREDIEYKLLDTAIKRFGKIYSKQVMGV